MLLDPLGGKDRVNNLASIDSNPLSPLTEAVAVPLQAFLMVDRHVFRNGAVLPLPAVYAAMRL